MITCVNCTTEAVYEYKVSKNLKLYYCVPHLPKFLKGKSDAGLKVKLIEKAVEVVEEPVEETVEEPKPAPKKRAPKKKKVEESTDGAD